MLFSLADFRLPISNCRLLSQIGNRKLAIGNPTIQICGFAELRSLRTRAKTNFGFVGRTILSDTTDRMSVLPNCFCTRPKRREVLSHKPNAASPTREDRKTMVIADESCVERRTHETERVRSIRVGVWVREQALDHRSTTQDTWCFGPVNLEAAA